MTSRVQKGGAVFRPVVHPRARGSSAAPRSQPHDAPTRPALAPTKAPPFTPQSHEHISHDTQTPLIIPREQPVQSTSSPPVLTTSQKASEPVPSFVQPTPIAVPHRASQQQQQSNLSTSIPIVVPGPNTTVQPPIPDAVSSVTIEQSTSEHIEQPVERPQRAIKRPRVSRTTEHNDADAETVKTKRTRKPSSGRRSRGPSLPPYDPNADPGEELDPTVVTMAALCDDTGQGRVSSKAAEILSNHAAWRTRNKEKRARMRTLMELKKYGRENEAEHENHGAEATKGTDGADEQEEQTTADVPNADENEGNFDYSQGLTTRRFNVQVRIGPNGETIVDEESLVVDRAEVEDTRDYTHVVESDTTKFVNSATYSRRFRGSRWSAEETERFYDALSQYGENYELIAYVLPGRDRKSCKNKFKIEDKKNPARINYCLNNRTPVDMQTLSRMTGKDFSGPVPEIRAPTPRPTARAEQCTTDDITKDSHTEPGASKGVRKGKRAKRAAAEEGVVIVGNVESDG